MVDCVSGINAFVNNGFGRYSPVEPPPQTAHAAASLESKGKTRPPPRPGMTALVATEKDMGSMRFHHLRAALAGMVVLTILAGVAAADDALVSSPRSPMSGLHNGLS